LRSTDIIHGLPIGARVLFLRLRSLGDVVLLTPALEALRRARPDLRVTVAVEPAFAAVLEGNPAVDDVLLTSSFAESVAAIRRRRFSVVYNQHGGPRSVFYTALSGAHWKVGWERAQYSFLYNVRVPDTNTFYGAKRIHTVEHRLTQLYWTGLGRGPIPSTRVFPQPDATASVTRKLVQAGVPASRPYAVLHPGGTSSTKRWPSEHFAEIAGWLDKAHRVTPVIRFGPGEESLVKSAREKLPPDCALFGPEDLDLRELIALVAGARLFVGNDSGPAHIAAAAGRPTVVIFGSSDSTTWRPWQTPYRVVQNDFPCNPCKGDRCYAFPEPRCILTINAEQVQKACDSILLDLPRIA
jgi:ADP-heptose:LPS heptosyltransferase